MTPAPNFTPETDNAVDAILNYYLPSENGETDVFYDGTVIEARRKYAEVSVHVNDIHKQQEDFQLDKQGFRLIKQPSAEKDFIDEEKVRNVYYQECSQLLKDVTGASRVHIISHIIRRQSWEGALEEEKNLEDLEPTKQPSTARFIHVDVSYEGAKVLLNLILPDESKILSKTRWAIVNMWRPIKTVHREPLCVMDAQSISDEELIERPLKSSPKVDGSGAAPEVYMWSVKSPVDRNRHRWYYVSEMAPEEVLLFKIFDSKNDGTAKRTPHCAFTSPHDYGPPRESLELRCLVFWEDQDCE